MDKREIIILYGKHVQQMANEACRLAGLSDLILEKCGSQDAKIALKPNLLGPVPAEEGATTHPEIAEGVIRYLRESGFSRISVMEGSWVGDKTEDSLYVTGFADLLRRLDVPFTDLQKDESEVVDCAGMKIRICKAPLGADFLINLPVMKGHCQTRMTCALKNMKGCIPNPEKRRFHKMGLFDPIGHLAAGLRQDFILTDSICSDLTFEDGGNPVPQNRIFAARDPVLNDTYCLKLMGISKNDVPYIKVAEMCGAGSSDLSRAKVSTWLEKKDEYIRGEAPMSDDLSRKAGDILSVREVVNEVDSCSACYGSLIPVLRRLQEEGYPIGKLKGICIGQGYRGRTGACGIGSCTSLFDKNLRGCPPKAEEMYRWLKNLLA